MKALAEELIEIYTSIGQDMLPDIMKNVGTGIIKTVAMQFEAFDFFK